MGSKKVSVRARTTRSKGKLLFADPVHNTQLLTDQLRSLGLYAAPTLGDGNCLFRALSDQLYGTPSHHHQLRKDICDWIQAYKHRYEPFVEDDRSIDVHLTTMRENGTYGGHLELTAFAHLFRRDVKVIQPALIYVIEWAAGGNLSPNRATYNDLPTPTDDSQLDERQQRRLRREQKRAETKASNNNSPSPTNTSRSPESFGDVIYVAYHDWEHFSSIRNLRGPHSGLPHVSELPVDSVPIPRISTPKKPIPKSRFKSAKSALVANHHPSFLSVPSTAPTTPSQIPLPGSRSPSPIPSSEHADFLTPPPPRPSPLSSPPTSRGGGTPGGSSTGLTLRIHRSPKRMFDESSGSSASEMSQAKRTRSNTRRSFPRASDTMDVDRAKPEPDLESTPGLSAPGSSAESTTSSSELSSPPVQTPPPPQAPAAATETATVGAATNIKEVVSSVGNVNVTPERPLTRRQRKMLGLPKPRAALVGNTTAARGNGSGAGGAAGRIVIPGGRYKKGGRGVARVNNDDDDEDEDGGGKQEWKYNGAGRVDVRGFRELKI